MLVVALAGCSFGLPANPSRERTGTEVVDCEDVYVRPVLDTVALVAVLATTAAILKYKDECYAIDCLFLPYAVVGSITMPFAVVHGYSSVSRCRSAKRRIARQHVIDEARVQREIARDTAWQLTKQAAAAARNNQCDEVRTTSRRVHALDEEFHATVFTRDVAIARCLAD